VTSTKPCGRLNIFHLVEGLSGRCMPSMIFLNICDVYDLGFNGLLLIFGNKQKGDKNVKVRLDRAVASPT
jgi:hypothetical protein